MVRIKLKESSQGAEIECVSVEKFAEIIEHPVPARSGQKKKLRGP
jgi:hypothetical protein